MSLALYRVQLPSCSLVQLHNLNRRILFLIISPSSRRCLLSSWASRPRSFLVLIVICLVLCLCFIIRVEKLRRWLVGRCPLPVICGPIGIGIIEAPVPVYIDAHLSVTWLLKNRN